MGRLLPYREKGRLEAGVDEAGRGCLAGPVVAAAVILRPGTRLPGLADSKKLPPEQRERLRALIERDALAWAVARAEVAEVDELNILQATFLAMHRAVASLQQRPECLLVDGNRFKGYPDIPHHCIVKGDDRYRSIAAASILAKTHRDGMMAGLDRRDPRYGWARNMGYPTPDHRAAIAIHGPSVHHRISFTLLPKVG